MLSVAEAQVLVLCKPCPAAAVGGTVGCVQQFCTERRPLLSKFLEAFKNHCYACCGVSNGQIFLSSL